MKYHCFLSYSHSADEKLAPAIQKGLHKLAKPWYKIRALNIFRDETDLSAEPDLWGAVVKGLDNSDFFLLLASPEAAKSSWVKKEINHWLKTKSRDNIILGLTGGNILWDEKNNNFEKIISTAIPKNLITHTNPNNKFDLRPVFDSEPLWVDFKNVKKDQDFSLENPEFKQKIINIAAKLHGKTPYEMAGEEVENHKKTIFIRNSVITGLIALLIGLGCLSIFAFNEKSKSDLRFMLAKSNELSTLAAQNREVDPTLALRLAEAALKLDQENQLAREIVSQVLTESEKYPFYEELGYFPDMLDGAISSDGEKFHIAVNNELITLGVNGKIENRIKFPNPLKSIDISQTDSFIVILDSQANCYILNTNLGEYKALNIPSEIVRWQNVSFSSNRKYIILEDFKRSIFIYDQENEHWIKIAKDTTKNPKIDSSYFFYISEDEKYLIYHFTSEQVKIFDLALKENITVFADTRFGLTDNEFRINNISSARFEGDSILYIVNDPYLTKIDLHKRILISEDDLFSLGEGGPGIASGLENIIPTNDTDLGMMLTNGYRFDSENKIWLRHVKIREIRRFGFDPGYLILDENETISWLTEFDYQEIRWEFRGGNKFKIIDYSGSNFNGVRAIYENGRILNWMGNYDNDTSNIWKLDSLSKIKYGLHDRLIKHKLNE